MTGRAEMDTFS